MSALQWEPILGTSDAFSNEEKSDSIIGLLCGPMKVIQAIYLFKALSICLATLSRTEKIKDLANTCL